MIPRLLKQILNNFEIYIDDELDCLIECLVVFVRWFRKARHLVVEEGIVVRG